MPSRETKNPGIATTNNTNHTNKKPEVFCLYSCDSCYSWFPSVSISPSSWPGVKASRTRACLTTSRPVAGAATSKVAPPTSTSTSRSPSNTVSPTSANQTLSTAGPAPSSGRRTSVRMGLHHLVGVITRTHEGAARHVLEPQPPGQHRQGRDLPRRPIPRHRNVLQRRRQVLPQRQHVAVRGAQVGQHLQQFLRRLAQPQHQPALGDRLRRPRLDVGQQVETAPIARPAADLLVKAR